MLILFLLFIIGTELNLRSFYWAFWGIAFAIELINLVNEIYFETNDEEENDQ